VHTLGWVNSDRVLKTRRLFSVIVFRHETIFAIGRSASEI
jgi:hypothetical protein